jgi:hypothetical protein
VPTCFNHRSLSSLAPPWNRYSNISQNTIHNFLVMKQPEDQIHSKSTVFLTEIVIFSSNESGWATSSTVPSSRVIEELSAPPFQKDGLKTVPPPRALWNIWGHWLTPTLRMWHVLQSSPVTAYGTCLMTPLTYATFQFPLHLLCKYNSHWDHHEGSSYHNFWMDLMKKHSTPQGM